ncbi:MAG: hypothetical protein V4560_05345 [Bacteroidota bacterium]
MKRNPTKGVILKVSVALLIVLAVFVIHSCKKDKNINWNTGVYRGLELRQLVQQAELKNWIKTTLPAEFSPDLDLTNAQQNVAYGHHVVRIPIGKDADLFFAKDQDSLKVFLYKWQDKAPGAKDFSGNLVVYSFQDNLLRTMVYDKGKLTSYRTFNEPLYFKSAYWHNKGAPANMLYSLWGKITNKNIPAPLPKLIFTTTANKMSSAATTSGGGGILSKL